MKKISNKNYRLTIVIVFITQVFLYSCNDVFSSVVNGREPTNVIEPTHTLVVEKEVCIGAFEDLAYRVPEEWGKPDRDIFPPSPWKIITRINNISINSYVELAWNHSGKTEVWIRNRRTIALESDQVREFIIYTPETDEYTMVSSEIGSTGVFVDQLFRTGDGSIWGRNVWDPDSDVTPEEVPVLSRYDPTSGHFSFTRDGFTVPAEKSFETFWHWPIILLDKHDIFWILIPLDGLYEYQPFTGELVKKIDIEEMVIDDAALVPDMGIYLNKLDQLNWEMVPGVLFFYSFIGGDLQVVEMPQDPWPPITSMVVDDAGRLWLGANGWLDLSGNWNLLHENVDKVQLGMTDYRWQLPSILLQSSNGILWFSKYTEGLHDGIAWYDPQTGEGCWFSNQYSFSMVEGDNQKLWMLINDRLYMRPIEGNYMD